MEDLIKALQILLKYGNPKYPTNCEHDELVICGIDPLKVSKEDRAELDKLGFFVSSETNDTDEDAELDPEGDYYFMSFRYGSA